ncbi:hypothetical protein [Streptomyces chromofuscus]|uniref:Uncharacterized protein n=1 Tax=Streptomyces chromofuscus TaxID=42881 RepID=A0A7M2T6N2_STRCW|nr:hypothetical protein [Streptomyces chromofuscus]QOV43809.1 hypothetical protein IPT68_29630 [Streptomyces chromofuscus]GGT21705.1 hypothetical protein GCM10010254_47830 [Streptomyces chromofuscus]
MTRPPTAAQRRVIDAADPVTGRLKGTEAQLAALVKRGLAFRHPRPPHDHFLTPAGHRTREAGHRTREAGHRTGETEAERPGPEPSVNTGVFVARVGGEEAGPDTGGSRVREVHSAWQGLLELRRMTNPDGATDRPCGWERTHLVRAAALALEAAGHRPAGEDSASGYRVRATPQPEAVAVHEPDAEALRACAATLERAGWQVGEHTEPRTRTRYLLASPRRA